MASPNNLEIKGNLREHPLAELVIEIAQARLNGSLRLNCESQKTIVYFDAGEVVFAVSNARAFRLFEILLRENKIAREELLKFADFTNDFLLGQNLQHENLFSKPEIDGFFTAQIEEILKDGIRWTEGEWIFSPLVRIKGNLRFKVELKRLLMEYARNLPDEATVRRFKNAREVFAVKPSMPVNINLSPQESFVFSRFEHSELTIENAKNLSGLSDAETYKILYTLWLGGFLRRQSWNAAFSDRKTSEILSASITLVKDQKAPVATRFQPPKSQPQKPFAIETPFEKPVPTVEQISVENYLAQVENASNLYEILALEPNVPAAEIKQAYFSLAKRFHPDLFHKETDARLQQRVQQAFGKLAQAYDTLRHEKNREVYNFKMRKDFEAKEKRRQANVGVADGDSPKHSEQAAEDFEQGFNLLMDEDFDAAIPFLARAAHLAKDTARFHAYYGKALATDKNQRHKAESELQTAVKLDEKNADYRLMLADFFVQNGLSKRAEGELNRLLAIFPGNREAKILLDSLRKK